jgi:hypothetical protein
VEKFLMHRERIHMYQLNRTLVPAEYDGSTLRSHAQYHKSAISRNIAWDLNEEQFRALTKRGVSCTYCGDSLNCMGIDRIDNQVGYTSLNTVSACKTCNYFKWNLDVDAFIDQCNRGVQWLEEHPIEHSRAELMQKMPSVEQMSSALIVHATQDSRKVRKPPPDLAPDTPVYWLKYWTIKTFHLYLECGAGRVAKSGDAMTWKHFATHTIPRRMVPENITLCKSCSASWHAGVSTPAPAVAFPDDAAAEAWLKSASSAFSKARAEQPQPQPQSAS